MKKIILFCLLLILLISAAVARADSIPPLKTNLNVYYDGKPYNGELFYNFMACTKNPNGSRYPYDCGVQYQEDSRYLSFCDKLKGLIREDLMKGCDWKPGFRNYICQSSDGKCSPPVSTMSWAKDMRIVAFIKDKDELFISDEITGLSSKYQYELRLDLLPDGTAHLTNVGLLERSVSKTLDGGKILNFMTALIFTLFAELFVAVIYLYVKKPSNRIVFFVFIANFLSLPIIWFLMNQIISSLLLYILTAEIFAIIFEAFFIFIFNRKLITFRDSFYFSLMANFTSFFLGLLLFNHMWLR